MERVTDYRGKSINSGKTSQSFDYLNLFSYSVLIIIIVILSLRTPKIHKKNASIDFELTPLSNHLQEADFLCIAAIKLPLCASVNMAFHEALPKHGSPKASHVVLQS